MILWFLYFLYIRLKKGLSKNLKINGRFADDSDIFILSKNVKGGES